MKGRREEVERSEKRKASSLYSSWPVSIDRRTFCFTPFALIRPSPGEHPFPPPFAITPTPPPTPFAVYFILIWNTTERRRWPTKRRSFPPLLPSQPFDPPPPQPTALPPSSSKKPPPPRAVPLCLPFASFREEKRKKEPGKRKERKEGMSRLQWGSRFGGGGFYLLFLSRAF